MTAEPLCAPVSASTVHVAIPPSECLNGCQQGSSDQRGPVLCQGAQLLCPECLSRLSKWLRALPDSMALLPAVLDHGTVPADPGTKHTKRPDPPAPMRLEVTDLLDTREGRGVLGVVHSWAEVIRDERKLPRRCTCTHTRPSHGAGRGPVRGRCTSTACPCTGYVAGPFNVYAECQLLIQHLPWCTEQEWAGDLYDEIRQLDRTLTDTLGDYRAKPVGSCAELGERPGVPLPVLCGGALVMDREGHGVRCVRCGVEIAADEGLRELGLIVGSMFGENGNQQLEAG